MASLLLWSCSAVVVVALNNSTTTTSRRHLLTELKNSQFHRLRRLFRTHSKKPDAFRKLTSGDIPRIQVNYGGKHPFEQQKQQQQHRETLDRPKATVNYPIHIVPFQPLRINFLDDPIRSLLGTGSSAQDDYINYILNTVLPETKRLWGTYLSVVPIQDNLKVSADFCYGIYSQYVPQSVLQGGLPNADIAIFVSMEQNLTTGGDGTVLNVCSEPGTLLVSTFCAVEQYDRPIAGLFNFCPPQGETSTVESRKRRRRRTQTQTDDKYPEFYDPWQQSPTISNGTATIDKQDVLTVAIHQMGHVLAMQYDLWKLFHNINTGDPFTPRPIDKTNAICADGSRHVFQDPARNTFIRSFQGGVFFAELVTTRVQTIVQSHFNCPTLTGAALESDPSQQGCVAGHWNERLFLGDLMAHLSHQTQGNLSAITLAVFEDSGWYRVSYHNTYLPFGQGWGCEFVSGDCIVNNTVPKYGKDVYCSTPTVVEPDGSIALNKNDILCDPLHQKWALCDLFNKSQVPSGFFDATGGSSSKSWFSDTNLVTTTDGFDSCPLPILTLQVDCSDTTTSLGINYQGELYGPNSRCINAQVAATKRHLPACFRVTCDAEKFQVVVNGIACRYDGEVHSIKTSHGGGLNNATFECPRISLVCPQLFCPSDCSGRGTCDYTKKPPECSCANNATTTNCQFLDDPTPAPAPSPTQSPAGIAPLKGTSPSSAQHQYMVSNVSLLAAVWCISIVLLLWK